MKSKAFQFVMVCALALLAGCVSVDRLRDRVDTLGGRIDSARMVADEAERRVGDLERRMNTGGGCPFCPLCGSRRPAVMLPCGKKVAE